MKKNQKPQQWAVLRKGGYRPIFTTFNKQEADRFIQGREDILFVAEVIQ